LHLTSIDFGLFDNKNKVTIFNVKRSGNIERKDLSENLENVIA